MEIIYDSTINKIRYSSTCNFDINNFEESIDKKTLQKIPKIAVKAFKDNFNNLINYKLESTFPGKVISYDKEFELIKEIKPKNIFQKILYKLIPNIFKISFKISCKINIIYPENIDFNREHIYMHNDFNEYVEYVKKHPSDINLCDIVKKYKNIMYFKMFVDKDFIIEIKDVKIA